MAYAVIWILLFVVALFLILLVLIQRGRGGGLAGAFGGMGGQSAFGTKAGDLFTKITIGVAAAWILLCMAADKLLTGSDSALRRASGNATQRSGTGAQPAQPGPAGGGNPAAPAPGATAPSGGVAPAAPSSPAPSGGSAEAPRATGGAAPPSAGAAAPASTPAPAPPTP